MTAGAASGPAGCLVDRLKRAFKRIEREILSKEEIPIDIDGPLFSVSAGWCGEDEDRSGAPKEENSYCRKIVLDCGDGMPAQVVLACSCPERPEWFFLLSYLVDMMAGRLRTILFERKAAFLLGDGFYFFQATNELEDEEIVAGACLSEAYHQIGSEMRNSFLLSFDVIDQLSLANYEKEGAEGVVLVAPQSLVEKIRPCTWFCRSAEPAALLSDQVRFVRKLMAGAAPDALLFSASPGDEAPCFCGVVSLSEGVPPKMLRSNCVQATIYGPIDWGLSVCGIPVCLRKPTKGFQLPRGFSRADADKRAERRIEAVLKEEFSSEPPGGPFYGNLGKTVQAVMAVRRQTHGAAAVVAAWRDPGSSCKKRLDVLISDQKAIPAEFKVPSGGPKKLAAAITQAAKMDGAVLIDALSGEVYALAVILDGLSCVEGNPERGARFNSLKNFTYSISDSEIVSFVFSSDGGMDIFSSRRPSRVPAGAGAGLAAAAYT